MKKVIKLTMALGLIGAVSAHAAIIDTVIDISSGHYIMDDGEHDTIVTGGALNYSSVGGRFRVGVGNTSSITINGGALNVTSTDAQLIGNGGGGNALIDLVSGSLYMENASSIISIGRDGSTGILRIQGGTAIFDTTPEFDASGGGNGSIDFTTANSGTLTVTGADKAYYEGLYAGTDLTFNSGNSVAFDEQFSVTGSTITAIPEPATLGLVSAFAGGILFIRRRFMM